MNRGSSCQERCRIGKLGEVGLIVLGFKVSGLGVSDEIHPEGFSGFRVC